jgi:hypothetical protein
MQNRAMCKIGFKDAKVEAIRMSRTMNLGPVKTIADPQGPILASLNEVQSYQPIS